ncbi:MAG: hypothetical protein QXL15_03205 [Candidatus Korarchaeota archaeon]
MLFVLIKTYFLIFLGWIMGFLSKKGEELSLYLSKLLVWILVPLSIVYSILNASPSDLQSLWVLLPLIGILLTNLFISSVYATKNGMDKPQKGAIVSTTAFSNTIFLPLGIFGSLFPSHYPLLSFLAFFLSIIFDIFRAVLLAHYSPRATSNKKVILAILKYPPLIAMFVSSILWLFGTYKLSSGLSIFFNVIKETSTSLGLITVGTGVSMCKLNKKWINHSIFVASLRLVFSPTLAGLIVLIIPMTPVEMTFIMIEAGMPPAAMNVVNAKYFDIDMGLSATAVMLSTLLLMFSLPFLLLCVPLTSFGSSHLWIF